MTSLANSLLIQAARTMQDENASHADRAEAAQIVADATTIKPGTRVLLRTATIYIAGTVVLIDDNVVVMVDCVDVIKTAAISTGLLNQQWGEVDKHPTDQVTVTQRGAIVHIHIIPQS